MSSPTAPNPGRRALVTGASSGIGMEMARLLATDGFGLVLVGRDRPRLEGLGAELRRSCNASVRCEAMDLARPGAASILWSALAADDLAIDVLVNNAGVGLYGPLAESDPAALEEMVQLNVAALTALTRLALSPMLQRGWGRILNVASLVAYQPGGPGMAAYYATKAFVLSLSRGLAAELSGSGVSVTALCPGPTHTAFESRSGASASLIYKRLSPMSAAAVARAGYRGMNRQATVVIPGFATKLLAFAGELPPRRIALEVNRLLLRKA